MTMFRADENCLKCGLCAKLCPARIIDFEEERAPWVPAEAESRCLRCGQCVAFCPVRAAWLSFQPEDERFPVDRDLMPSAEDGETLLRSRRSIRRYRDEALDRTLIRRLLETVRYAPSASNLQPVRWIVTETRDRTVALAALVIKEFERQLASSGDLPGQHLASVVKAWQGGYDIIMRGAPHLAVAVVPADYPFLEDAAIALTYFELAAHANGVGCCWAGYFTRAARQNPELKAALGLGENEMVVGGQMFGRPDGLGLSRLLPPRKKLDLTWL